MLETYIFLPYLEGIRGDCNSRTWESSKEKKEEKEIMGFFSCHAFVELFLG